MSLKEGVEGRDRGGETISTLSSRLWPKQHLHVDVWWVFLNPKHFQFSIPSPSTRPTPSLSKSPPYTASKPGSHPWFLFFLTPHFKLQQIHLILPSKYIWNPSTSLQLHRQHSSKPPRPHTGTAAVQSTHFHFCPPTVFASVSVLSSW